MKTTLRLTALAFAALAFTAPMMATAQVPSINVVAPAQRQSYSAVATALTPASTPTDFMTITGSATKTIRVVRAYCTGVADVAASRNLALVKRSTANSGGTATTVSAIAHDSTNSAATGTVKAYTGNPTAGTLVGYLRAGTMVLATAVTPGITSNPVTWDFGSNFTTDQGVTLRGTGQVLAINGGSVSLPTNSVLNCGFEWNEQ